MVGEHLIYFRWLRIGADLTMRAFHSNWTRPFFARYGISAAYYIPAFELLTTALSALTWRQKNGSIAMLCDTVAQAYYQQYDLAFLWDDGIHPVLDSIDREIDPICFWAAGKLYALRTFGAPCMMIDTDFIVWQALESHITGHPLMTIHRESITPDIYPDPSSFHLHHPFPLDTLDCTILPANTALSWFEDPTFTQYYCQTAIAFMQAASPANHSLTYMVFAEQRLLPMLAAQAGIPLVSFADLFDLFTSGQTYFTHIWGFKQRMMHDPATMHGLCTRCARRLMQDFPQAAERLQQIPDLFPYFQMDTI